MRRVASPKDRKYLESLNLKALQKSRPKGDQDPKEYYKALQDEAKSGPLFNDKVLDTVEHLPDLPKPVSKWLGNMDDKELHKVGAQDLRLIIDWAQGSEDADLEGLSWDDAMEAQQNWHDQIHDDKEDCGEYKTHKVVFSTGGYEFVDLTTDHDLQVEGCKLKHCVGGDNYCRAVKNNHSRIISMRNSKNEPLVTIEYLVEDKSVVQCYGYKNHPPAKKLNEPLVKFFEHMGWEDGIFLLKNYTITEEKWDLIIENSTDARLRSILMQIDTIPVQALHTLYARAEDIDDGLMMARVARNKAAPAAMLRELIDHKDPRVRHQVLSNRNTPKDVVVSMLTSPTHYMTAAKSDMITAQDIISTPGIDDRVRGWMLAHRKDTPADVLVGLAMNADWAVRETALLNTNLPAATLRELSKSDQKDVRRLVAKNTATPPDVLHVMAVWSVTTANQFDSSLLVNIVKNPSVQPKTLEYLVTPRPGFALPMQSYHWAMLDLKSLPAKAQEWLAQQSVNGYKENDEQSYDVARLLLDQDDLTDKTKEILAKHPDGGIRRSLSRRYPNIAVASTLRALLKQIP